MANTQLNDYLKNLMSKNSSSASYAPQFPAKPNMSVASPVSSSTAATTPKTVTASPAKSPVIQSNAAKTFIQNQIKPAQFVSADISTPPQNLTPQAPAQVRGSTIQEMAAGNTTGTGAGSTDPNATFSEIGANAAPQTAYDVAMNSYLKSLQASDELDLQAKKDQEEALSRGETAGFASGEAQRVNRNNAFAQEAATNKANAGLAAVNALGKRLPATPEPFNLSPGQKRFDASGKEIASLPDTPQSLSEQYGTGSIGEYNFAKSQGYTGSFTQYQNEDANRKRSIAAAGVGNPGSGGLLDAVLSNPELFNQLTPTAKAQLAPALASTGFNSFGKPLSDTAIKEINQTDFALSSLNDLKSIITSNADKIGPVVGLAALNPYSDARKIQADVDRVRQTVGKALEGGVLRKEDEEKYKKILATLTDTPSTATYKIDQLINSITKNIADYKALQGSVGGKNIGVSANSDPLGLGI